MRIRPLARSASTLGRRSPPVSASIIASPDLVAMLEATESILIPASWSTLPSLCSSEVLDLHDLGPVPQDIAGGLDVRGRDEAARSSPHSSKCTSHSASAK